MSGTRRVGVVGAGQMGELHARAIHEHPLLALGGVADVDESKATDVADRFGTDAYGDHMDLYRQTLDGVVVATPESAHGEPVRDATEWGYDILLEKPISDDPAESKELAAVCHSADVDVLLGFTLRFDARYGELKRRAEADEFGRIVSMRAERSVVTEEAERMQRSHPLLYQTIHDMDFMRWLKGAPVKRVYAEGTQNVFADTDVTDVVFSTLRFADGTIGCIETGSILPSGSPAGNQANFHLKGTEGMARLDAPGDDVTVTTETHETPDTSLFTMVNDRISGAITEEMDHFGGILRGDTAPAATLDDALQAEAIARATRRSLESGAPETVTNHTTTDMVEARENV
jgi:myo-inositol 2-dehydrogenase/D-chiro-inositol 1-dehydrogenase